MMITWLVDSLHGSLSTSLRNGDSIPRYLETTYKQNMCLSIPVNNKAAEASEKKVERYAMATSGWMCKNTIRCVNECPTMHYLGIPRHTHSMIIYNILTEYLWKFPWRIALWECCHKLIITSLLTQLVPEGELNFHTLYKRNVDDEKAHSETETLLSQLSLGK